MQKNGIPSVSLIQKGCHNNCQWGEHRSAPMFLGDECHLKTIVCPLSVKVEIRLG